MSYYDDKRRELLELVSLVKREKAAFEKAARLEREALDKDIRVMTELGVYGPGDSEARSFMRAKKQLEEERAKLDRRDEWLKKEKGELDRRKDFDSWPCPWRDST